MQNRLEPCKVRWKPARLGEVRLIPPNPWRGLYAIYPFTIGDEAAELPVIRKEHSLGLVEINLVSFRDGSISDAGLHQIRRILAWFEDHRQEMILRFSYDLEGNGLKNEPHNIEIILSHIRQLAPILRRFSPRIYTLQGLFIGSWGEMHTSLHTGAKSMIALAAALDEAADGSLFVSVRCPNQWREIAQTADPTLPGRLSGGKPAARLGLYNDAILASETDYGTYGMASKAHAPHYGVKLNREEELKFQHSLCAGVPNGGELIYGDGGFTLPEIYRVFRLMRLSYLNADFDMQAIVNLRTKENPVRSRAWRSADAYTYLTEHLGYRYCVRKVTARPQPGGVTLSVQVENTGFACCYFPLEATLYLRSSDGDTALALRLPGDTRRLQPGEKHWLAAELNGLSVPQGTYQAELELRDPRSGKPVYIASAARGAQAGPALPLGTLRVRR